MNDFNRLIKDYVKTEINSINTLLPAKIKKYYPSQMRADIIFLNKVEVNGEFVEQSCVYSCPVILPKVSGFFISMPYKEGDVVMVAFSQVALDNLLDSGQSEVVEIKRRFSLDDAVVLGGVQIESKGDLGSANGEDIILENIETNTTIKIKSSGDIEISGSKNINITNDEGVNITTADCTIDSSNSVIIKSQNTVDIDGGEVNLSGTVKLKNFLDSNPGFCLIPHCLFTGAPHTTGTVKG